MHQAVLKAWQDLHSWIGLVLGLLLYVVCFSGVVALFEIEIGPWERTDTRPPPVPVAAALDRAVAEGIVGAEEGLRAGGSLTVLLPDRYRPAISVQPSIGEDGPATVRRYNPATGQEMVEDSRAGALLLRHLHTDLLLPAPWGRYLVGGLGVVMLVSVITGALLHRKMIVEAFTLRLARSRRLAWTDAHKIIGLWGLPFHAVLALTGAVLGFAGLVLIPAALTSFRGDAGAALDALGSVRAQPAGIAAPMVPLSDLLDRAQAALPGMAPEVVVFQAYGDAEAVLEVFGNRPGALVYYPSVTLRGVDGAVLAVTDWSGEGIGRQLYAMVTPLHYASYGGLALKLLYAILGAGTCFLAVSGLHIWRARHRGHRPGLDRLATAVFHGLPLATLGLLVASRLLPRSVAGDEAAMMAGFLALWAACAAWPWVRGAAPAARDLGMGTAVLLLACPLVTMLAGGGTPWTLVANDAIPVAMVDALGIIGGAALLGWTLRTREARGVHAEVEPG